MSSPSSRCPPFDGHDDADDFQSSSKELEEELERELLATEEAQQDLRAKITKLEGEKDDWKVRSLGRVRPGPMEMRTDRTDRLLDILDLKTEQVPGRPEGTQPRARHAPAQIGRAHV